MRKTIKMLMEEIKEELNKEDILRPWVGRHKMSVLPNLIHRCSVILIKIPASYFVDINKLILKFIWRSKGPRIANAILKDEGKAGRPNFSTSRL